MFVAELSSFDSVIPSTAAFMQLAISLKFIDSCRFMQDSLSNLKDNLSRINNKVSQNKIINNM